jgi:hypothetical protein
VYICCRGEEIYTKREYTANRGFLFAVFTEPLLSNGCLQGPFLTLLFRLSGCGSGLQRHNVTQTPDFSRLRFFFQNKENGLEMKEATVRSNTRQGTPLPERGGFASLSQGLARMKAASALF